METGTACGEIVKRGVQLKFSQNKELMHEAYGAAKMARKMCAISAEQMRELNTKLVRNGINNPKTWNAE